MILPLNRDKCQAPFFVLIDDNESALSNPAIHAILFSTPQEPEERHVLPRLVETYFGQTATGEENERYGTQMGSAAG